MGNQAVGKHLFTLGERNLVMWDQVRGVELRFLPRELGDAGAALALQKCLFFLSPVWLLSLVSPWKALAHSTAEQIGSSTANELLLGWGENIFLRKHLHSSCSCWDVGVAKGSVSSLGHALHGCFSVSFVSVF